MNCKFCFLFVLALFLLAIQASAIVPSLVTFQGRLTDALGDPVADGSYSMKILIYDSSSGGNLLWNDNFTPSTASGLFSVILGSGVPLDISIFSDPGLWVGIQVEGDPELSPRTQLTSVPYSTRVGTIDGSTGGAIFGNVSIQSDLAVAGNVEVHPPPDDEMPSLLLQSSFGQTDNHFEVTTSMGGVLMSVDPDGDFRWEARTDDGQPDILLQTGLGQTDNRLEVKSTAGDLLLALGPDGNLEFHPPPDDIKPSISLRSALTQNDNHVEVTNFVGGVYFSIDPDADFVWEARPDDGRPDMLLQSLPGQTDNKLEIKNDSDELMMAVGPFGNLELIPPPDDNKPSLLMKSFDGQTDNHLEVTTSLNGLLTSLDPEGQLQFEHRSDDGKATLTIRGNTSQNDNYFEAAAEIAIDTYQPLCWIDPDGAIHIIQDSDTDPVADAWTTYSSAEYKKEIHELSDKEYSEALEKVVATPVVKYRYKNQTESDKEKIGIVIEDAPAEIVAEGNPKAASLSEYISLLHAALKAQQTQISNLEARLNEIERQKNY